MTQSGTEVAVYYDPLPGRRVSRPLNLPTNDVIILKADTWDDFDFNTLFQIAYFQGDKIFDFGAVRLLIEGVQSSREILDQYAGFKISTWLRDTTIKYISLGGDSDYYRALTSALSEYQRNSYLALIHDAVFLQRLDHSNPSLALRHSEGFQKSLLRSLAEKEAFSEASQILFGTRAEKDRSFTLEYKLLGEDGIQRIEFDFRPNALFPSDINLLVGVNGTGKTQALKAVLAALFGPEQFAEPYSSQLQSLEGNSSGVNPFSQVTAISYSPFENFPIRIESAAGMKEYQYCGFRDEAGTFSVDGSRLILREAVDRLLVIANLDNESFIQNAPKRFETFIESVQSAFVFDALAVFRLDGTVERFWDRDEEIKMDVLSSINLGSELIFLRSNIEVKLSAGQINFVALTLAILQHLRQDSLLLVDEPELFLHPNLELQFMRMIRSLMSSFSASAIIATHSMILARETPQERLWVLRRRQERSIVGSRPPFQSFGADLTRIGNFIFDDAFASHPYVEWLRNHVSAENSKEILSDPDITPELASLIRKTVAELP